MQSAELISLVFAAPEFELFLDSSEGKLVLRTAAGYWLFPAVKPLRADTLRKSLRSIAENPPAEEAWAGELRALDEAYLAALRANDSLAADRTRKCEQLDQLQKELDETNRGVLALYAELDDRAFRLQRADDLKSRFLSYASHELRTPLNGISGLARLLSAGNLQGEQVKQLTLIQKAAQEMREMVDDLLDLAKVEAGKITVEPAEFGLELVFGALRGMFRPLAGNDALELHFEDTSAVPSIYTDEGKVVQILRNFVSNALKFTERGEIRVWAELAANDTVRISVKDTGIGIAPEDQARVFEEFAQINHPLQRKVKGTGFGLPLCKKLAELLGGSVELESQRGAGSKFTLVLPRVYRTERLDSLPEKSPVRPFTVLHVEDEEIDRYLVAQLLRFNGNLRLVQAVDGQAALEAARRERPDLIILDLNLPRIGGWDLLEDLRITPETRSIPVAVLTASDVDSHSSELLERAITVMSKDALANAAALVIENGPPVRIAVRRLNDEVEHYDARGYLECRR